VATRTTTEEWASTLTALLRRPRPRALSLVGLGLLGLIGVWLLVNLIKDPERFFTVFLIGMTTGLVYALIALGYTLVYGILQLINFAHGDVFAFTGLVASTMILTVFDLTEEDSAVVIILGLIGTLLVVVTFGATVNSVIERVAYHRLLKAPRLALLITAVGMSFIVQNIALAIYDVNYRRVPELIPRSEVFSIGGVEYQWNKLTVVLVTIPVLLALTWLVRSTRQGKGMRATAQDPDAAAMVGIDVNRTISFTFALAGGLAGVGGLLFLLQFNIRYDSGFELGLIAFTAAVLGGIGNLTGAVLGAVTIGLIQAFNEGLTWFAPGSDWTRSIVFGVLIAILVFRPQGILGEHVAERA
jgi:branched-chain amino acid transport system permease protein